MRLNVGCGTHYADGWVNTDAVESTDTHPDVRATGHDFPFTTGTFEQVYLGHVLEHVPWPDVEAFLTEVRRVLQPGGRVLATGPDVFRMLHEWDAGRESWELCIDTLEHQDRQSDYWPEAVHKWNCHETRLAAVLTAAGFIDVAPAGEPFDTWPVVDWSAWQCAVQATAPG